MIYIAFFGGASKLTGSNKFKHAELLLSVHDHNGADSHIQPHQKKLPINAAGFNEPFHA